MSTRQDCTPRTAAGRMTVQSCTEIQEGVFSLELDAFSFEPAQGCTTEPPEQPLPGQFYMLRSVPSSVLLGRPISIYRADKKILSFLILKRGTGTRELCGLEAGDIVDLIGPLGNTFPRPVSETNGGTIAIIGGGIGVAPVAGFASTLSPLSYDFYACYRSASYGLAYIKPRRLVITTEDGCEGTRGMLPLVFTSATAREYAAVCACGPEPMLRYVQKTCAEAGVPCFLSLEARMACGMGACLGCSIETVSGRKRCCSDGPIFSGSEVIFK